MSNEVLEPRAKYWDAVYVSRSQTYWFLVGNKGMLIPISSLHNNVWLVELDCKERLQLAQRGCPRRKLEEHNFSEGQPVQVWTHGRRGALAKVGPCFEMCSKDPPYG